MSLVAPLSFGDVNFAISSRIEGCPRTMMIRELHRNALDAAAQATGLKEVRYRAVDWECSDGTLARKLAVWNTGPGMDSDTLVEMMNIAATTKQLARDKNFGMGAKVAGLKSNPYGMRYRSCKDGQVSQVILRRDEGGVYGLLKTQINGGWYEVADVTDRTIEEGMPEHYDWTEVVLLGAHEEQDTVEDPYNGDPPAEPSWLVATLAQRFYKPEQSVTVKIDTSVNMHRDTITFRGLERVCGFYTVGNELIDVGSGVRLHYMCEEQRERHRKAQSTTIGAYSSHITLVYKEECYDFIGGRAWQANGPTFGVTHGASAISIHIHLPDDYPCLPEMYRRHLQRIEGTEEEIRCEDFSEIVYENRPQWLIEFIASQEPSRSALSASMKKRLNELLKRWRRRERWQLHSDGEDCVAEPNMLSSGETADAGAARGVGTEGRDRSCVQGDGPSCPRQRRERRQTDIAEGNLRGVRAPQRQRNELPQVDWASGGTTENGGHLAGKAGSYYPKVHKIVLNQDYEPFGLFERLLMERFSHVKDRESLATNVRTILREEIEYQATAFVLIGKSHLSNEHWSQRDVIDAMKEGSLTIFLDNEEAWWDKAVHRLSITWKGK